MSFERSRNLLAALVAVLAACSSGHQDGGPLWAGEAEWVKLEEGWAQAVPLAGSTAVAAE